MRRRRRDSDESLDLLLDTITNTFGGLIFIALLIALLVGKKEPLEVNRHAKDSSESDIITSEIEALKTEYDMLLQQQQLGKNLQDRFVNTEQRNLVAELQQQKDNASQLRQQIDQVKQKNQIARQTLDRKEKELKEVGSLASSLETKLSRTKNELDNEKAQRTTEFDSPVLRTTSKRSKAFVIKRGRLYNIGNNTGLAKDFVVNLQDFEKATQANAEVNLGARHGLWKTRKDGGISIDNANQVKSAVSKLDPKTEFVNLVVFDDSFEKFNSLRQVVVDKKLDYSLILLKDGEQVVETTSTRRPKVQ